ncbi:uncharacterized protein METZ01_LOCUS385222, partial [marine metagenome]
MPRTEASFLELFQTEAAKSILYKKP